MLIPQTYFLSNPSSKLRQILLPHFQILPQNMRVRIDPPKNAFLQYKTVTRDGPCLKDFDHKIVSDRLFLFGFGRQIIQSSFAKYSNNSKVWKMMIRSGLSHDIRYLSFKGKQAPTDAQALHMSVISPLTKMLNERNRTIESLYRGQKNLHFCRSSLHLAIGVLDKLILRGFHFEEEEYELVAGSLLLLCTKFNEVYPVTVRKINMLMIEEHSLDQFVEMEGNILQILDFNLFLEDALYEELAEFEARFQGQQALTCQEVIKTAILNPAYTFKHGTKSLMLALESLLCGGALTDRGSNNSFLHKQMTQIRGELSRLHSSSRRRLLSPCRA